MGGIEASLTITRAMPGTPASIYIYAKLPYVVCGCVRVCSCVRVRVCACARACMCACLSGHWCPNHSTKLGQQMLHIRCLKVIVPHHRSAAILRPKSRFNVTFTMCSISRYLWREEGREEC